MSSPDHPLRLLLVDDHVMFRENLCRALEREPGLAVVGQTSSAVEAAKLLRLNPDVVILDVDLGPERGVSFLEKAAKTSFAGRILVLTAGVSGQEAVQLVQGGVAGILHKQHSTLELCDAIRKVASGESCVEEEYVSFIFRSLDRTRARATPELTERERVVLRHVLEGLTNREIGELVQATEGAVKGTLRQLFDKLGVRTRAQLVKIALGQYRDQLSQNTKSKT